ncbi:hypothetical protein ACLBWZ_04605 [Brucellaceae bacterium C25G]
MLNKSVIAFLLLAGLVLVSFSTVGKLDTKDQVAAYHTMKALP